MTEFNIADLKSYVLRELATKIDESNDEKEGHNGKIDNGAESSIFIEELNRNKLLKLYNDEHSESYRGGNDQRIYENVESIDISQLKDNKLVKLARDVLKNGENILSGANLKEFLYSVLKKKQGATLDAEIKEMVKNNPSQAPENEVTNPTPQATPENTSAPAATPASAKDVGKKAPSTEASDILTAGVKIPEKIYISELQNPELRDFANKIAGGEPFLHGLKREYFCRTMSERGYTDALKAEFTNMANKTASEEVASTNSAANNTPIETASAKDVDKKAPSTEAGDILTAGVKIPEKIYISELQNPELRDFANKIADNEPFLHGLKREYFCRTMSERGYTDALKAEFANMANKTASEEAAPAKTNKTASTAASAPAKVNNTASAASSAASSNGVLELEYNDTNAARLRNGTLNPKPAGIKMNGITHYAYEVCNKRDRVTLSRAYTNREIEVHKDVVKPFEDMRKAAAKDGVNLIIVSGFRTKADQVGLFNGKANGSEATFTKRLQASAPPGFSEHHTGLAIDICSVTESAFEPGGRYYKVGQWLKNNAARFGFEISFPENNAQGLEHEPWHLRYVGTQDNPCLYAQEVFKEVHNAQGDNYWASL